MAGAFADIGASIKEVYSPKLVEPMANNKLKIRPWLKKSLPAGSTHTKGGYLTFVANTIGSQAVAQATDNTDFPSTYDRTDVRLQLKPTAFYGAVGVGMMSLHAVDSSTNSFNKGELARQSNDVIAFLGKFIDSTYAGTHGTGRRARVSADGGANEIVMAKPEGVKLLRPGYLITERTTDGGATVTDSIDNVRITKIVRSSNTITYAGTDRTPVAGDHIHVVTGATQTLTSVFANGFRGLFDDGTFQSSIHGATRSTYAPKLYANVYGNGGTLRNLSEQILLHAAMDTQDVSGKAITDVFGSWGQALKWVEFMAPDKRIQVQGSDEVGSKAMGLKDENDLVFFAPGVRAVFHLSYDIVPRELYLLNSEHVFHYVAAEMGWCTEAGGDGLFLNPGSSNYKTGIVGYIRAIENIGADWFDCHAVVRDLVDPECND